ncbi:MAG: site-specific DNA-methyltransferase [Algibacter sp.]|uniref:site-specific DNA-methyltransferase n=1 Tax=Algibacter sp. TaxID=1872428 RepID=UPI00329956C4
MPEEFKPSYTFTDDRLNELKQLFPEAFEDGVFNVDTLTELIGEHSTSNRAKEHFGLNWVGKQDARKIATKPPTGTLKPCEGEGVNEDTTENIFIEGENLEVLKILRKSYMGKIKMIYIDPPYNTGDDFIYSDSFADSTEDYLRKSGVKTDEGLLVSNPNSSGRYHANWLSFMYPRLKLAKDLLKEDGIIFISIADQEIHNLKSLCNEIFGEENFIEKLIWKNGRTAASYFAREHEYILCYGKDINKLKLFKYWGDDRISDRAIKRPSEKNPTSIIKFPKGIEFNSSDKVFPNQFGEGEPVKVISGTFECKNNVLVNDVELEAAWTMKDQIENWISGKEVVDQKGQILEKFFFKSNGVLQYQKIKGTNHPKSIITDISTKKGSNEILKLFGSSVFDFPKPSELLKHLIDATTEENDMILDFFAGSASTFQGFISSENLRSINRKIIIIQIDEELNPKKETGKNAIKYLSKKNKRLVISELSKERCRLAIREESPDIGFKVFKQNTSTIYKWQEFVPDQDGALPDLFNNLELAYKNPLQHGVTTQDFITEVILQEGFPLTAKQEEVVSGFFKITHEWVPYTLYATMLYSFKDTDFSKLQLQGTDHFVCLDKAFEGNDALKQELDNQCKIFTI